MAARPPRLEKLRHGRLLVGRVFRFFVETWNWLTEYVDNLQGDLDANPKQGCITVDRTKPDRPVIRLRVDKLPNRLAGIYDGPFTPTYPEDHPETVTGFENCYYMDGGRMRKMEDQTIPGADGFIALKVGTTPDTAGTAELVCYETIDALETAQEDVTTFIVPLYEVEESQIILDLRRMPVVFAAEVLA